MTDSVGKLLIATTNRGKLRELRSLLRGCPFALVSPRDIPIKFDASETGSTLEENAAIKATAYARMSGMLTLADDSGLEVEALGGAPGVLSSRYAGPGATDADLIAHLLQKLDNIPEVDRGARFRCVIAVAPTDGPPDLYVGECFGRILSTPRGGNGFGYDPIFLLPELGRTMAEISPEEKDRISHRGEAARRAAGGLRKMAARIRL